jgi:hypothetical protein
MKNYYNLHICNLCPVCQEEEKEVNHTFFKCKDAQEVWSWLKTWSGWLETVPGSFNNLLEDLKAKQLDRKTFKLSLAVAYVVLWSIWKLRN